MTAQSNSIAYVQAGSHRYPLITERRCRTCTHPQRMRIETEVVQGRPWTVIANDLPDATGLSPRNIRNHFVKGHLPVKEESVARLAGTQAEERGQVVAAGADHLVEHAHFAQAVVGVVNQRVRTGQAVPSVRDGLAAAVFLAQLEAAKPPFDPVDLNRVMLACIHAAQEVLPDDLRSDFLQRVTDDPLMREMGERWDRAFGDGSSRPPANA